MAAEPFSSFPTSRETRFDSQPFRLLLLRRLRLPLPLSACRCRCGRLLDVFGHHRAACATVRVLGRRGFALESAAARVCREAGTRPPPRPEPSSTPGVWKWWFGALQRSPTGSRHHFGLQHSAQTGPSATVGGEALRRARARKERTYPELAGRTRQIGGPCCRSGWTLVKRSFPVRAFFGVGQSAECSGVHPNPSGTRMESEMEETSGMHSSKVVREHVAGVRVANRCQWHNTLRG